MSRASSVDALYPSPPKQNKGSFRPGRGRPPAPPTTENGVKKIDALLPISTGRGDGAPDPPLLLHSWGCASWRCSPHPTALYVIRFTCVLSRTPVEDLSTLSLQSAYSRTATAGGIMSPLMSLLDSRLSAPSRPQRRAGRPVRSAMRTERKKISLYIGGVLAARRPPVHT
jgi:hypothetical protein